MRSNLVEIDLTSYRDFVLEVTSEPSMKHSALVDRLEELQYAANTSKVNWLKFLPQLSAFRPKPASLQK